MKLRPYQQKGAEQIRKAFRRLTRVLYQAPTGAGKTVLFSYIAKNAAAKGKKVYILVHRQELIKQASKKLLDNNVIHGVVWKKLPITQDIIQVCSVQTLVNRLGRLPKADMLIIDEAHHATAGTYKKIIEASAGAKILGVTATPNRADGKGLSDIFEELILGPQIHELIEDGYLAKYRLFVPPSDLRLAHVPVDANGEFLIDPLEDEVRRSKITGDAIKEYLKVCPGKPAITYTVSVKIAYETAAEFNRAGIPSACVEGNLKDFERAEIFKNFESGKILNLVNVDLISEGTDLPEVIAEIDLQPTKSEARQIQKWGRAFRLKSTGEHAIFLDHAGNRREHGLPCEIREFSLAGSRKRNRSKDVEYTCKGCFISLEKPYKICPYCGHNMAADATAGAGREAPEIIDGELIEVTPDKVSLLKTKEDYENEAKKKGRKRPGLYAQIMMESHRARK